MLSYIRAIVVGLSFLLFGGAVFAPDLRAAEASPLEALASLTTGPSPPILLGQYSGNSRSSYSSSQARIPYGVIRLIVLGIMGAGGWLGSKLYR
jgi:hypothetical protein